MTEGKSRVHEAGGELSSPDRRTQLQGANQHIKGEQEGSCRKVAVGSFSRGSYG